MRPIAVSNPPNPWQVSTVDYLGEPPDTGLIVYEDHTKEILSKNDSPDVPFTWSVNPYRGCFHGCAYCYARPTHEYLGFGAGTDFERKIVVKPHAGALLRETFERKSWKGENIVFSGVTDCYQPLEASYGLTRACLEVCLDYRNPAGIITKSPLVERDIPLLVELSKVATVHVCVSIPFWNESNARKIEPYVTTPARRMKTVERLSKAGISVTVMVAPIIPGLNDEDIPDILSAAKDAGATGAGRVILRLPGHVKEVFSERLYKELPLRADKVIARTREVRGGKLYDSSWSARQSGEGNYAEIIAQLFDAQVARLGLNQEERHAEPRQTFRRPTDRGGQMRLFGSLRGGAHKLLGKASATR